MSAIEDGAMQDKDGARIDALVKRLSGLEKTSNDGEADEICAEAAAELTRLQGRVATLQKALDDHFAADRKAAKAIFKRDGRKWGFPDTVEVVAWYVAEVESLEKVLAGINVHRNALLRENDSLRAKLERAKEALKEAIDEYEDNSHYKSEFLQEKHGDVAEIARLRAIYAELSADAPAHERDVGSVTLPGGGGGSSVGQIPSSASSGGLSVGVAHGAAQISDDGLDYLRRSECGVPGVQSADPVSDGPEEKS